MVLGGTCIAAREVSLDILHRNVRAGRNGNKQAFVPTHQGVLTAAAVAAVVDTSVAAVGASAAAAADVARGAVKSTAAFIAQGAAKPTAADYDYADGLGRRACREHCHGLRGLVKSCHRAPGRCLAALHLRPWHGCRQHFRPLSLSPRSVPGLPPIHQAQCLLSSKKNLLNIESREKAIQDSTINLFFRRRDAVSFEFHHQGFRSGDISPDRLFSFLECQFLELLCSILSSSTALTYHAQ